MVDHVNRIIRQLDVTWPHWKETRADWDGHLVGILNFFLYSYLRLEPAIPLEARTLEVVMHQKFETCNLAIYTTIGKLLHYNSHANGPTT